MNLNNRLNGNEKFGRIITRRKPVRVEYLFTSEELDAYLRHTKAKQIKQCISAILAIGPHSAREKGWNAEKARERLTCAERLGGLLNNL